MIRALIILFGFAPNVALSDIFADKRDSCAALVTLVFEDCGMKNYRRCEDGSIYSEHYPPDREAVATFLGPDNELISWQRIVGGDNLGDVANAVDSFSLTELLESGSETVELQLRNYSTFGGFGRDATLTAQFNHTAETKVVSERVLQVITHETVSSAELGVETVERTDSGLYYYDASLGLMLSGPTRMTTRVGVFDVPDIAALIGPNDPYFMLTAHPTCEPTIRLLDQ